VSPVAPGGRVGPRPRWDCRCGTAATTVVKIASPADGSLRFDQTHVTAPSGAVTLSYTNTSSTPHGIAIESSTGSVVTGGGVSTVTLTLKTGAVHVLLPGPRSSPSRHDRDTDGHLSGKDLPAARAREAAALREHG
jgi:hypothetical protein